MIRWSRMWPQTDPLNVIASPGFLVVFLSNKDTPNEYRHTAMAPILWAERQRLGKRSPLSPAQAEMAPTSRKTYANQRAVKWFRSIRKRCAIIPTTKAYWCCRGSVFVSLRSPSCHTDRWHVVKNDQSLGGGEAGRWWCASVGAVRASSTYERRRICGGTVNATSLSLFMWE